MRSVNASGTNEENIMLLYIIASKDPSGEHRHYWNFGSRCWVDDWNDATAFPRKDTAISCLDSAASERPDARVVPMDGMPWWL